MRKPARPNLGPLRSNVGGEGKKEDGGNSAGGSYSGGVRKSSSAQDDPPTAVTTPLNSSHHSTSYSKASSVPAELALNRRKHQKSVTKSEVPGGRSKTSKPSTEPFSPKSCKMSEVNKS